jgi:hypothetical protein
MLVTFINLGNIHSLKWWKKVLTMVKTYQMQLPILRNSVYD